VAKKARAWFQSKFEGICFMHICIPLRQFLAIP
jgi:hypothetical protein